LPDFSVVASICLRRAVFTLSLLGVVLGCRIGRAETAQGFLNAKEMMARARLSGVQYVVQAETIGADPANVFWPRGSRSFASWSCSPDAEAELETMRKLLTAGRHADAVAGLEQATRRYLDCAAAWVLLGKALIATKEVERALAAFDWAEAIAPDNADVADERGKALLFLQRRDEALAAFRKALSLRPRDEWLIRFVAENAAKLDVAIDEGFVVRALARGSAPKIDVFVEKKLGPREAKAWTAFSLCKGFWIGNPKHRKRVTGNELHVFSSLEEEECLKQLVAESTGSTDPTLTRLRSIVVDSKLLDAFITYEFAARIDPDAVLRLPPEARARVARYVAEYVLVDTRRTPSARPTP